MQTSNAASLRTNIFWIVLISTLLGLVFFSQGWVMSSKDYPFNFRAQFIWAMSGWYMWAALFPLILRLSRWFPFDRNRWRKSLNFHLVAAVVISFLHAVVQVKATNWMPYAEKKASDVGLFANGYIFSLVMWRMVLYVAIVSAAVALDYYRKYREGQILTARIEARILRAQMEALKMQMDPDFLFETLHSITDLMHRDLSAADKMIARLGDFLRLTLDSAGTSQVSLRKELEFLKCYLEIQKIRFQGRFQIDLKIEPVTLDARVPNLLLYSLVEQTLELRRRSGNWEAPIQVTTRQFENSLRLEVIDAMGAQDTPPLKKRNLDERMRQIYGSVFSLLTEPQADGSRKTTVVIPWVEGEEDSPALAGEAESTALEDVRGSELEWAIRSQAAEEERAPKKQSWWKPYAWSSLAFTFLGIFFVTRETLSRWLSHEPIKWMEQATWFVVWYLWALVTPYIFAFCRRFPLERPRILRHTIFHLANSALILSLMSISSITYNWFLDPKAGKYLQMLAEKFRNASFSVDIVLYWMIVAFGSAVNYYREYRRGEVQSLRLRAQLSRAQLQALKMQLHPHFLFNTLNSISELMQEEMDTAEKMMSHLERFLRLTVQNSEAQEVPFETEIEFLKCYLEIEHVRFQDRLSVSMEIEPQAMKVPVPNLLLQPIVENAIRHGIAPRSTTGHIDIRASRTAGNKLQVSIQDDGPGMVEENNGQRKGLGLANTRERLQQLYGKQYRFEMTNAPGGGLIVTLEIPVEMRA